MGVQGIPEPQDLDDQVMVFTALDNRGFVSEGVRRDSHLAYCIACGNTHDLALTRIDQGIGKPYSALLCRQCDQTFRQLHGGIDHAA